MPRGCVVCKAPAEYQVAGKRYCATHAPKPEPQQPYPPPPPPGTRDARLPGVRGERMARKLVAFPDALYLRMLAKAQAEHNGNVSDVVRAACWEYVGGDG